MAKYNYRKDVKEMLAKVKKSFTGKNGKVYEYQFDEVFPESKKTQFIKDFIAIKQECDTNKETPNYDFIYEYLIVKHFTDVIPSYKGTPYEICVYGIDTIKDVIEIGIYEEILMALNQNEIKKLNTYFKDGLKAMQKILDDYILNNKEVLQNG